MTSEQEKKNKRIGMMVSIGVHLALIIAFIFLVAWREPDPPIPEYGIELNFGVDEQGSGEIQPETPVTDPDVEDEPAAAEEEVVEEQIEEQVEEQTEEVVEPVEAEPEVETTPVDNTQESPDVVTPVEKAEEPKEKVEEVKEPVKTVTYPGKKKATDGTEGETNASEASQGDDPGTEGDKGKEEGTVDARAQHPGTVGGGGNGALQLGDWGWGDFPKVNDQSSEVGIIVFTVIVDKNGEIVSIKTDKKSVSATVEMLYKNAIEEQATFVRKSGSKPATGNVSGTITFVLKSN